MEADPPDQPHKIFSVRGQVGTLPTLRGRAANRLRPSVLTGLLRVGSPPCSLELVSAVLSRQICHRQGSTMSGSALCQHIMLANVISLPFTQDALGGSFLAGAQPTGG